MKQNVILSLCGKQYYEAQDAEKIELITEGVLEQQGECWRITYEESALTGLEGVTTTFEICPQQIILTRTGALRSQMIFQLGVPHESLYQMDFGALLISVCAQRLEYQLSEKGGTVDLTYGIDIENSGGGIVEYHLDIKVK